MIFKYFLRENLNHVDPYKLAVTAEVQIMKKYFLIGILILFLGIFISSCKDDDGEEPADHGTLTVQISGATVFDTHNLFYTIYDSNTTGNEIGEGIIAIVNGSGSFLTVNSIEDQTTAVYNNGTYYLGGCADLNDNFVTCGYTPDSGDRLGGFVTVVIEGDKTVTVTEDDFSFTYP